MHPRTLLFVLSCCALAQPLCAADSKSALMWKISSGRTDAYVLGSIHVGSKTMFPLPQEIEQAFDRSPLLLVEVDFTKMDPKKVNAFVMANAIYPGDDVLWNHIKPETKTQLETFSTAYGANAQALAKLKPWLAAVTISMAPMQKAGMAASMGIDKYFLDRAKDKKVEELETGESQFQIFASLSDAQQERYLAATLDQAGKMPDFGKEMEQAWSAGDADKVDRLLVGMFKEPADVQRKLREDRNPHMAEAVERHLRAGEPCFVVVGAAHVVGTEGIVRLLEKKGFRVEQVRLN